MAFGLCGPWLRYRFGLHRWDEQENPETHELFELGERCDACRDRHRAAPGDQQRGLFVGIKN